MIELNYEADGLVMTGYLAGTATKKPSPGVLVAHEAGGVNDHIKSRTQALAELGYVAFALENFPLATATARHAELMASPGTIFRRASAALNVLGEQKFVDPNRIGAIGFCQGGVTVLELARGRAPVRCAVGFHPGLKRPEGSPQGRIDAKVLMMIGDDDPLIPAEDRRRFRQEMMASQADWQLHVFGGVAHSFTNSSVDELGIPGLAYDADADRRSWNLMQTMLSETIPIA